MDDPESIKKSDSWYDQQPCKLWKGKKVWGSFSLINWMSEYVSVPYRIHLNIYQSQAPTFRVCSRKNIWNGLIYSACLVLLAGHSHHHHSEWPEKENNKIGSLSGTSGPRAQVFWEFNILHNNMLNILFFWKYSQNFPKFSAISKNAGHSIPTIVRETLQGYISYYCIAWAKKMWYTLYLNNLDCKSRFKRIAFFWSLNHHFAVCRVDGWANGCCRRGASSCIHTKSKRRLEY